jgi:outer membrane protein assembly factor BamD (BamD/ComL family)
MPRKAERTVVNQRVAGNPMVPGLYAMSFLIGAVSLIGVLFKLGALLSRRSSPVLIDEVIYVVMLGVGGLAVALLLAGIGAIINYLQNQVLMMARLVRAQEDAVTALSHIRAEPTVAAPVPIAPVAESPSAQTTWIDSQRLEQIGELLHEINENVLLSGEQRQAKRRQNLERLHRDLGQTLLRLLAEGKFPEAQRRLDEYAMSFPEERVSVEQFQSQVDRAREQAEEGDYQQAAVRVRDFMAMAAWQRAEEVLQELLERHPRSQRVRDLVDGLRQERTKFEQQQRQQMLSQIEHLISQKEYRQAHQQACDLVHRFPGSGEAQSLLAKMDTLRDNAEIAIRRELEEQLKEMMRTHRYIEALGLSQEIIGKYPGSPQAKVLKEQMPQLMTKAKLQMEQAARQ